MNAEIKRDEWKQFLETLSKRRFAWTTRIEVFSSEFGDQNLNDRLPFNGTTLETRAGITSVGISVGENIGAHQTHTIMDPVRIAFLPADSSHGDIVDIEEKDGNKTLITFIEPMGIMAGFAEVQMIAAPL
jgi:uncharacterized protein DUF5335